MHLHWLKMNKQKLKQGLSPRAHHQTRRVAEAWAHSKTPISILARRLYKRIEEGDSHTKPSVLAAVGLVVLILVEVLVVLAAELHRGDSKALLKIGEVERALEEMGHYSADDIPHMINEIDKYLHMLHAAA